MFKVGDKVVCVNNEGDVGLTMGKIYIITSTHETIVVNDLNEDVGYFEYRFISLQEYRKQKIEKIYESVC